MRSWKRRIKFTVLHVNSMWIKSHFTLTDLNPTNYLTAMPAATLTSIVKYNIYAMVCHS